MLGNNMFAYCGNNPICRSDTTGQLWGTALATIGISAVASVAVSAISAFIHQEEFTVGDAVGAAIEGAAAAAMVMLGVPAIVANPVATFSGGVIGKFVDGDTSREATLEILDSTANSFLWSGVFGGAGKIIPQYVDGKYLELNPVGRLLREVTYQPRYLNESSVSTIVSENFWGAVQNILTDTMLKH